MPALESPVSSELQSFAEKIRRANREKKRIAPKGGGTHSFDDSTVESLHTSALTKIVSYAPDDLVITVEAGMRFRDLQTSLSRNGQWLPLEPPADEHSTIGGIVASNAAGASRARYGNARHWLRGARFVAANGDIIHTGSSVVKSVAGYDVHTLLIGSRGALAAIVEMSLKVAPLPERRAFVLLSPPATADALRTFVHAARALDPVSFLYCTVRASAMLFGAFTPCLVISFDGFAEDVEMQLNALQKSCNELKIECGVSEAEETRQKLDNFTFGSANAVRIIAKRAEIVELLADLNTMPAVIDLANGTADVVAPLATDEYVADIAQVARRTGVHAAYLWRRHRALAGGPSDAEKRLAQRLKYTFDPENIFGAPAYYE